MDAVRESHAEVAKYLKSVGSMLDEDFASMQLSEACAVDDDKKVSMLMALGVNPSLNPPGRRKGESRRTRSAAHMAASRNSVASIRLLIKNWVKLNTFDALAGTPLADAIRHEHVEMQDVIWKAGGKLKEVGLCHAAAVGNLEKIKLMCDNGADFNVVNGIGRTMLHLARSTKQPSVIEYLMEFEELDYNVVDWYGGTALDDAYREENLGLAVTIKEAGGLSASHPSLAERVAEIGKQKEAKREAATKSREKAARLDLVRKTVSEKVRECGEIAVDDIATLRRLWDSLKLSLDRNTWKMFQAQEKAPNPTTDEVLEHFRFSFSGFMERQYAVNNLRCFEVLREFSALRDSGRLGNEVKFAKAVRMIVDDYFDADSPSFVDINPDTVKEVVEKAERVCGKDNVALEDFVSGKEDMFEGALKELENMFESDFLPIYWASHEYRSAHKHPSGRMWRVLKMATVAREVCERIESELANVVEGMVMDNEMQDMYLGSTGLDIFSRESAKALRKNMQSFREKVEMIVVAMRNNYIKGFKKADVLHSSRGGGGAGGEVEGGRSFQYDKNN